MHDIVGSIRRGQGMAEIDEHGGAPGRAARLDVALAVSYPTRIFLLFLAMPVDARLAGIEGHLTRHDLVHRVHFRVADQAVSHVRLVGDYRQEKTRLL